MAIQITLNANQFNYSGKHNGREYTSLQVKHTSKGRIYFSIVRDGIRLSEMAKQIKLEDGNAIVTFGKNDKLIIGTYKDSSIQEEQVTETIEETSSNESVNDNNVADQSNEPKQDTSINSTTVSETEEIVSNVHNQMSSDINDIKVNKQKEKILLKDYMGNGYEEYQGQYFEYKGVGFYLIKSNNRWCIVEKTTKLYAVKWRKQRKQVFSEFLKFMSQHLVKVKEYINNRNNTMKTN